MRSAVWRVSALPPIRRREARKPRRCTRPRKKFWPARSTRAPRALRRRATSNSCWRRTITSAGPETSSACSAAGEDVLRPRARILADEQLTGASREAVQERLDHWIKAHIEKLLGPLVAVSAAEDVTGIARGVAFQLVEGARRARTAEGRRRREGARSAVARDLAQIRRALRRLSHLHSAACSSRRRERSRRSFLRSRTTERRIEGPRRSAGARVERAHVDPDQQGYLEGALSHRRLSRVRASARCASIFWSGSPI